MEGIDVHLSHILKDKGFTNTDQLKHYTPSKLANETGIPLQTCLTIIKSTKSVQSSPRLSQSLNQLLNRPPSTILTMSRSIDELLGGGIFTQQLTQLFGKPGTGKTQFCMQLACSVQIPSDYGGVGGSCIYIDCEGSLVVERLAQIGVGMLGHMKRLDNNCSLDLGSILDRIHVAQVRDWTQLCALISELRKLVDSTESKLVIIDSLAMPFRQFSEDFKHRKLAHVGRDLCLIASEKNISIVVVNHETGSGPALGQAWSHFPQTSLHFEQILHERKISLVKSTAFPKGDSLFTVTEKGIRDAQISLNGKRKSPNT